jgi:hypothetical protein
MAMDAFGFAIRLAEIVLFHCLSKVGAKQKVLV